MTTVGEWLAGLSAHKPKFVYLDLEDLPEDVVLGHLCEIQGIIPHDQIRAEEIENSLCRGYLREAEAFAFGYQMGKKLAQEDKK